MSDKLDVWNLERQGAEVRLRQADVYKIYPKIVRSKYSEVILEKGSLEVLHDWFMENFDGLKF